MGTFDSGVFDNDAALDILDAVVNVLDPEIDSILRVEDIAVEGLEELIACIAIKNILIENCRATSPTLDDAQAIRTKLLKIYDRDIEQLEPTADYLIGRRIVMVDTLDKYVSLAMANEKK